jgi:hypothetical protein
MYLNMHPKWEAVKNAALNTEKRGVNLKKIDRENIANNYSSPAKSKPAISIAQFPANAFVGGSASSLHVTFVDLGKGSYTRFHVLS